MTAWANSTRRSRLPADWPKRRATVLKRDERICHICHQPDATEVDHIRPGDDHSLANLAPAHKVCHQRKTIAERPKPNGRRRREVEPHPGLLKRGET